MRTNLILILSVILMCSCEQEIDHPIAEYCWPVVHCLINFEDSVHYLRLGKTFSGPAVEEMINNIDSLYFKEANVYFDFYKNGNFIKTIQLELTDDLERDPGTFPPTPFRLYKTDHPIKTDTIVLRIEIPELNRYVKGEIRVRDKPHFDFPDPEYNKLLDFYKEMPVRIKWNGYKHVAKTTLRLWYAEKTANGTDTCKLDWIRYHSDFILLPEDWFDVILWGIQVDNQVVSRRVLSVDILAEGGNSQYSNYLDKKDIVFDLIGKPFSNIIGAYGFVGSRAVGGTYGYFPDREFMDSLCYSPRTEKLKFIHW